MKGMSTMSTFFKRLGASKLKSIDHNYSDQKNKKFVGALFSPVVTLLKIIGYCPIATLDTVVTKGDQNLGDPPDGQKGDDDEKKYGVTFKSWFFLWTAAVAVYFIVNNILGLVQTNVVEAVWQANFLKAMGDNMAGAEGQFIVKSMVFSIHLNFILVSLRQMSSLIFSWTEASSFAQFLNQWKPFQDEFSRTFPPTVYTIFSLDECRLSKRRNRLLFFCLFMPIVAILETTTKIRSPNLGSLLLTILSTVPLLAQSIGAWFLEDTKVILSYNVVADAFTQIRKGITCCLESEPLTPEKLKKWRHLVYMVRQQSAFVGRWQAGHQMFLIGVAIIQVTLLSFVLLNGLFMSVKMDSLTWILQSFFSAFLLICQIYIKILSAEQITKNEALIATTLESMDVAGDMDFGNQMEIKFLHDMIKIEPAIVSFGAYVILDKKLLLGIFSQVVTYLIVIMQFSRSQVS